MGELLNKAMERKLKDGSCLDVRVIGKEIAPGVFELEDFIEDVDYCDVQKEAWIGSIGRDSAGRIFASTDSRYYLNPDYTCLWLR